MPLFLQAQTFKENELDKIVKEAFAQQKVAGASVLIAQNGKIILNKGYGFAHLGFRVPATPQIKIFLFRSRHFSYRNSYYAAGGEREFVFR